MQTMKKEIIIENGLAMIFYFKKELVDENTIKVKNLNLYFPGLPQMVDDRFFEQYIDNQNIYVQVCYYGSWLSDKKFTYLNCLESIKNAIKIISSCTGATVFSGKKLNWAYEELHIIAYSFSGHFILKSLQVFNKVESIKLLAPMAFIHQDNTRQFLNKEEQKDFTDFNLHYMGFLHRGYKNVYRGIEEESWKEFFAGNETNSYLSVLEKDYPIEIYIGEKDELTNQHNAIECARKFRAKIEFITDISHDLYGIYQEIKKINKVNLKVKTYSKNKFEKMLTSLRRVEFGDPIKREQIEGVNFEIPKQKVIDKLEKIKAKRVLKGIQRIFTYDYPNCSLRENNIVLRTKEINGNIELQYKKLIFEQGKHGRREQEIYFKLNDQFLVNKFLLSIGLVVTGTQERQLISYITKIARYNIETWPNTPTYLGTETKNYENLVDAIAAVDLNPAKTEQIGGVAIFKKYNLKLKTTVFGRQQ